MHCKLETDLTPPIKFKAQKLAAKFSVRCQVRCSCYERRKNIYYDNGMKRRINSYLFVT